MPASAAALREANRQRKELLATWQRSETMTLTNVEQMPPELFTFRYTEEAMNFVEQWRHCVVYLRLSGVVPGGYYGW